MPKLTFYPLGNADCCLIDLARGEKLLFDYADTRCADDPSDKRADLPKLLREDLDTAGRSAPNRRYEVVAFTHLDQDHICGASEFFQLRHAKKYQGPDRAEIEEMWVPALAITEDGCTDEARIIQAEARFRLIEGQGIRVFSRPELLKDWLADNGLSVASRRHLFVDAGQIVPRFNLLEHGVEFFVHSPFAERQGDGSLVDRNADAIVVQATFAVDGVATKLILGADSDHEDLSRIVRVSRIHKNEKRLEWDVFKLPHHCSYLSLSPDKGVDVTKPVPEVEWLFEPPQAQQDAVVVSTSKPIPSNDDDPQPPHRQAANYHKQSASRRDGEFKVTMEHPSKALPAPIEIEIDRFKATLKKRIPQISVGVTSRPASRAGVD